MALRVAEANPTGKNQSWDVSKFSKPGKPTPKLNKSRLDIGGFSSRNYGSAAHSEETRSQISALNKGRQLRLSQAVRGKPVHKPPVEAIVRANKSRNGEKHSPEHIRKTVEANRGRTHSSEAKRKISVARILYMSTHAGPCRDITVLRFSEAEIKSWL